MQKWKCIRRACVAEAAEVWSVYPDDWWCDEQTVIVTSQRGHGNVALLRE
jgi:hypothetical protein